MTNLAIPLPARGAQRLAARGLLLVVLLIASLAAATSAQAEVTEVAGLTVGLQHRDVGTVFEGGLINETLNEPQHTFITSPETFANDSGNPVMHSADIYVVYWDPGNTYNKEWQRLINGFVHNLGATSGSLGSLFAVDGQYRDQTNQPANNAFTFRGAYTDVDHYPASGCSTGVGGISHCLTDAQIKTELQAFIADHHLVTGMSTLFYMLTPPGVAECLDAAGEHCSVYTRTKVEEDASKYESTSYLNSFCSYHDDINPDATPSGDASTVLYAVVPWIATNPDGSNGAECQDGGFNPSGEFPEIKEKPKERSASEKEAFEKGSAEEKLAFEEQERLEAPHAQEPEQTTERGENGTFDTGLADLIINQMAVELQDASTDPLLNAWQDEFHNEASDECRNFFARVPGDMHGSFQAEKETDAGTLSNQVYGNADYYLQLAFNDSGELMLGSSPRCLGGVNLDPKFTPPNTVNAGDLVSFDGMESDIDLLRGVAFKVTGSTVEPSPTYAQLSWNFGDGTPTVTGYIPGAPSNNSPEDSPCEPPWLTPCAGSSIHSYQYGGTYVVTLTATDLAGDKATVTHEVTVVGPSAPGSGGSSSGSSSTSTSSSGTPGSAGSSVVAAIPAPTLSASILSRTLAQTASKGLVVHYKVNEQVAGHLEVLVPLATAERLGLSGPLATGLPTGSPAERVVATAVLITTRGGESTLHIHFSKHNAKRLSRAGKLPVTVMLVVRNASNKGTAITTVSSSATLVR